MDRGTEAPVDGRTARRDRNRDLVLDAVIDLFTEHQLAPTPAEVAARSGVSLRSVYRYFEDFDALVRAAVERNQAVIAPLLALPDLGVGPLAARVERFVAHRLQLHEATAPVVRATLLRAPTNSPMRDRLAAARADLRTQTAAMFAPELATMAPRQRDAILAALDTLTQFEGIESLRVRLGYPADRAADVLRRGLTALLAQPDPPPGAAGATTQ